MLCFNLSANVNLDGIDTSSILVEATTTIATIMEKPEAYVIVVITGFVPMSCGKTEHSTACTELVSVGGLTPDTNKKLTIALFDLLATKLNGAKISSSSNFMTARVATLDVMEALYTGLETPSTVKNVPLPAEVNRPSPIESPMSRLRVSEERHTSPFSSSGNSKPQDMRHLPVDGLTNANDGATWQMWNSSPLVQDGVGLVGGATSWLLPAELNRPKNKEILHPVPRKTMASLFKKYDAVLSSTHSPQEAE